MKKRKVIILALTILPLLLSVPIQKGYPQTLQITTFTDMISHDFGEKITIYGNLTKNSQLLTDGLVAIQVKNPTNTTIVIRTVQTGPNVTIGSTVYVHQVIPCDFYGNPKDTFQQGTLAYFKILLENYNPNPLTALITINLFDNESTPIGYAATSGSFVPRELYMLILSIAIPLDATVGQATICANAYTDWPSQNGTPYCPEKTAKLQITGTTKGIQQSNPKTNSQISYGNYNLTFKISENTLAGKYQVYVSSKYLEETAYDKTYFGVLSGDVNRDLSVDSTDLGLLGMSWGLTPEDPYYNPYADLNKDGIVDSTDLGIMGSYWGFLIE